MTGAVLKLVPPDAGLRAECDTILQDAMSSGMQQVLVLGFDKSGQFHAGSSTADAGELLYLCELFKNKLMSGDFVGD